MNRGKFVKNLIIVLTFVFLFAPIVVLVLYSFNESKMNVVFTGFTFKWYGELLKNTDLLEAFFNTLIIAFTSTVISTIIGTISAIGLQRYSFRGKNFVNALIYIPIVIPEIVLGISLLSVYTITNLKLGMFSLILSHIAFSIPFVITSVRSSLNLLPREYEQAAYDLGADKYQTFTKIILPLIKPGVVSGATLALTLSLDDVVISYFTAGPGSNTLPLKIYSMIKTGITPDVNALSTILLLVTIVILTVTSVIQSRKIATRGAL